MRFKKYYDVTFDTIYSRKRRELHWSISVIAYNQKEAIEKAKEMWYGYTDQHMFHIKAYKWKETDVRDYNHWFVKV